MLSGDDRPGRSPISMTTAAALRRVAMASPSATRPWRATTSGAMRKLSFRSAGTTSRSTGAACACTARADRPSATTKATS